MKRLTRKILFGIDSVAYLLSLAGILGWLAWLMLDYRADAGTLDPEFHAMLRLSDDLRYLCLVSLILATVGAIVFSLDTTISAQGERIKECENKDAMDRFLMIAATLGCSILGSSAFLVL